MFQSIRWQLVISYILLALLVVGAVGSITYQLAENYAEMREMQGLQVNASAIALQAEPLMYSRFAQFELQSLAETSAFLGDFRVVIRDMDHRALADSGLAEGADQFLILVPDGEHEFYPGALIYQVDPDSMVEFSDSLGDVIPPGTSVTVVKRHDSPWGKQFTFEEVTILGDVDMLDVLVETPSSYHRSEASVIYPIGDQDTPIGYVELSEPVDFGTSLLDQLKQALVTAGVGAVILAVIFGLWNSYRLASPIKDLAATAEKMGAGDLSTRANLKSGGEIGALGDRFNRMADSLQDNIQQLEAERDALRRFIADASHELRTPITALKNFNILLLDRVASDREVQTEFLQESQAQIERLGWITSNLLDLSRMDSGLLTLAKDEHDLREIIDSAVSPFNNLTEGKQIVLTAQLPDQPVVLSVDRQRLEMAVANLLDNAVKFTPEGGEITVTLDEDPDQISLSVRDTGPGIPDADLPHIFERFYRGRGHSIEGSGLGLSIVKSTVEAHGGRIQVECVPGEGSTFTIQLSSTG